MGKRKRKSQNNGAAAPAQQSHHTGPSFHARRPISYGDIDEAPASPPKRRQISYASSDLEDEKPDNESSNTKTTIHSTKDKPQQQPQLDVDYGQRGAFPGLDNSNEPFYGPANDGLDYLRMVRSEARQIPHVVRAPNTEPIPNPNKSNEHDAYPPEAEYGEDAYAEEEEEEYYEEDAYGYYEDGAYIAYPTQDAEADDPTTQDPQDAYHEALMTRYLQHRQHLSLTPTASAIAALPPDHPISLPQNNRAASTDWRSFLRTTTPLPAQLASMDNGTVLRLLKIVHGQLQSIGAASEDVPQTLSLWAWGLLGRLGEVGVLGNWEVGAVRDLAKCAGWVVGRYEKRGRAGGEVMDEDEGGIIEDSEPEAEEEGKVSSERVRRNTRDGDDDAVKEQTQQVKDLAIEAKLVDWAARVGQMVERMVAELDSDGTDLEINRRAVYDQLTDRELLAMTFQDKLQDLKEKQLGGIPQGELEVLLRDALDTLKEEVAALGQSKTDASDEQDLFSELTEAFKSPPSMENAHQEVQIDVMAGGGQEIEVVKTDVKTTNQNSLATLDMIITIVGEFYGQKDLLELRPRWDRSGL